jgi:hypothetical protein
MKDSKDKGFEDKGLEDKGFVSWKELKARNNSTLSEI